RQRERAAWQRAFSGNADIDFLELGDHTPTRSDIALPFLAELDRACRSVQQLAAGPLLEERDGAADRGRRAAKLAAGGREAPLVDRDDEDFHGIKAIHSDLQIIVPLPPGIVEFSGPLFPCVPEHKNRQSGARMYNRYPVNRDRLPLIEMR